MVNFQTVRNGYKKEEVDVYIEDLKNKLDNQERKLENLEKSLIAYQEQEKEIKQKGENISIALTSAVEKAKQIENSSKNVYKLKIEELEVLYKRWEKVLNEIVKKYPNIDETNNVKELLKEFKNNLKSSIKDDFKFANVQISQDNDPMRVLLGKMNKNFSKQLEDKKQIKVTKRKRTTLPKDMKTKQTELSKFEEKAIMIKPIYNAKVENDEKYESLLDKFLTSEATIDSAYANKLTAKTSVIPEVNESGFDLKEAVNPKDSLEAIMSSFDFFSNN